MKKIKISPEAFNEIKIEKGYLYPENISRFESRCESDDYYYKDSLGKLNSLEIDCDIKIKPKNFIEIGDHKKRSTIVKFDGMYHVGFSYGMLFFIQLESFSNEDDAMKYMHEINEKLEDMNEEDSLYFIFSGHMDLDKEDL